jgi:hypothetical protein
MPQAGGNVIFRYPAHSKSTGEGVSQRVPRDAFNLGIFHRLEVLPPIEVAGINRLRWIFAWKDPRRTQGRVAFASLSTALWAGLITWKNLNLAVFPSPDTQLYQASLKIC